MADRPLIVLPAAAVASRTKLGSGPSATHFPSRRRQGERLSPRFDELRVFFEQRTAQLQATAAGQVPEEVIVFETIGTVANFLKAAGRLPGLDFLAEYDVEDIAPDDDFYIEETTDKPVPRRLFLVMTNQQALQQLLNLWRDFQANRGARQGFAPFFEMFRHLRDIRRWSVKDRLLETGVDDYWRDAATARDDVPVPFEIELWYRSSTQARAEAVDRIRRIVGQLQGNIVSLCELAPICYHAAVATLPVSQIRRLADLSGVELLAETSVMCFRPSGQTVVPSIEERTLQTPITPLPTGRPTGNATVALFDGLPLENHARLAGRLRVDDPDNFSQTYNASEREHGTTMASIILHGDINAPRAPLSRPLYVRPILRPDPQPWNAGRDERIPFGVNALDLTQRAVHRLMEGDGTIPAVAPSVKIISFSIGDPLQQFHSAVSAWGRLLDWLAFKYNLLFCVSAGNYPRPITLNIPRNEFSTLTVAEKEAEVLKALNHDLRLRRILSPSDSINAITVGAWHHDYGPIANIQHRINPFSLPHFPSPINGLGCGFRNATKPDILLPGGRQFYQERLGNTHTQATLDVYKATVAPGILAASPSNVAGQTNREKHTCGTSNATALAARSAAFLYEQIISLRGEAGGDRLTDNYAAVLLKAMLIHKANWGTAYNNFTAVLRTTNMSSERFKRLASRFLGHGFVEPFESISGADHRATMLGCGELGDGNAHSYRIPLPPSLSGVRGMRRVTVTLAWLSPISPKHRNYRKAALWFEIENAKLSTNRKEVAWQAARNGTVQHEIFEGTSTAVFSDNETMQIKVNCRSDADVIAERIRYGIVVTIEVAGGMRINLYDEIATRIRPQVPIRAANS